MLIDKETKDALVKENIPTIMGGGCSEWTSLKKKNTLKEIYKIKMKIKDLQLICPKCGEPHLYFFGVNKDNPITGNNFDCLCCCNCGLRILKMIWEDELGDDDGEEK